METGVIVQYDDIVILPQLKLLFSYFFYIRVKIKFTNQIYFDRLYIQQYILNDI